MERNLLPALRLKGVQVQIRCHSPVVSWRQCHDECHYCTCGGFDLPTEYRLFPVTVRCCFFQLFVTLCAVNQSINQSKQIYPAPCVASESESYKGYGVVVDGYIDPMTTPWNMLCVRLALRTYYNEVISIHLLSSDGI